jgi:Flagellin and related hook-associated proteins
MRDESGAVGAASSISLSGDELADLEIAGTLSASGTASNATAQNLSLASVATVDDATAALASIDNALEYISSQRSELGAIENRLNHTVNNLMNVVENTSASRSRIEDADYAVESANLAKLQVMQQAGTAMLAQANASGQLVLSLLG